jgi:hypothetical protein
VTASTIWSVSGFATLGATKDAAIVFALSILSAAAVRPVEIASVPGSP